MDGRTNLFLEATLMIEFMIGRKTKEQQSYFYYSLYEHTPYIKNEQALTLGTGGF